MSAARVASPRPPHRSSPHPRVTAPPLASTPTPSRRPRAFDPHPIHHHRFSPPRLARVRVSPARSRRPRPPRRPYSRSRPFASTIARGPSRASRFHPFPESIRATRARIDRFDRCNRCNRFPGEMSSFLSVVPFDSVRRTPRSTRRRAARTTIEAPRARARPSPRPSSRTVEVESNPIESVHVCPGTNDES